MSSPTGSGFLQRVRAAAEGRSEVSVDSFTYANEEQGFERLPDVIVFSGTRT